MDTFEKLKEIIVDTLSYDGDEIKPESDFFQDLKADSLDVVELMMAVEENFGIKVPDDEVQKLHTVQSVVDYIDAHKAN
ncbi:acyl carrier protein [Lachnospiraceae bacterium YH-ros2228]|jgi:acyl carrier protein|nr:acyl carrier protein [Lachnospiraceae bacterium]MDD6449996.1 acyl carrier protein [Lachnospiraceae bacterium]MDD6451163.1 acyl carrier protein [Lachnospiraceae bacterium]MDD6578774.1 acyl carrier protein [Lachnospiraceae bacterium]